MANLVLGRLKRRQCLFPILLRGVTSMAISEVSGYAMYTEHLVERDFHDLQSKTVPVFLGPIGAYEAGDRRLPRGPMPTAAQLIPAMVQRKRRFTCSNTIRA